MLETSDMCVGVSFNITLGHPGQTDPIMLYLHVWDKNSYF